MSVYELVMKEIRAATTKFPTWPTDPLHAIAVLGEEYGELQKAVLQSIYEPHKSSSEDVRNEAIQTAAMAIRFLLSLDSYKYQRGQQHAQTAPTTDCSRAEKLEHLYECGRRLRMTAPVDDDFPKAMHEFDGALRALEAAQEKVT